MLRTAPLQVLRLSGAAIAAAGVPLLIGLA